jgi:fibronectin type 3 domain-containing protein
LLPGEGSFGHLEDERMGRRGWPKVFRDILSEGTVLFVVILLALAITPTASAEDSPEVLWTRDFSSSTSAYATAVAVDDSGVYLTGITEGTLPGQTSKGYDDFFLRKYDDDGDHVWTQQFGSPYTDDAPDVAVFDSGVYVAGNTGELPPAHIYKYDTDGNEVWSHEIMCSDDEYDMVFAIAADASGVYVAGRTAVDGLDPTTENAFIRKYTLKGTEVWTHTFGDPSAPDWAFAVAVDGSGVYVGGVTDGALEYQTNVGSTDAFLRKYDKDGNKVWTRQFGSSDFDGFKWLNFRSFDIAVDTSGVYVAGNTSGSLPDQTSSGHSDAYVRKYDLDGDEVWTRQFGTSGHDMAYGIDVTNSGVYVAGQVGDSLPGQTSAGYDDAFIRRYDIDGNEVWTHQFGTTDYDAAWGIEAHTSGLYGAGRMPDWKAFVMKMPFEDLNLDATVEEGQVVLGWSDPYDPDSAITNFRIYRGTASDDLSLLTEVGNVLGYTDTEVTKGVTYYYQVSAVSGSGEGPWSNVVSATPLSLPSAPTSLNASIKNGLINLNWTAPLDGGAPITNYNIYRGLTSGDLLLLATTDNVLKYVDSKVSIGIEYFYQVSAVNELGEGPRSEEVSATPIILVSEPLDLRAYARDGQVDLIWKVPTDRGTSNISYRVYRGPATGAIFLLVGQVDNQLNLNDTNVTNGVMYFYQVTAVSDTGEGPRSNETWAIPASGPASPNPVNIIAGEEVIGLTWSESVDNSTPITGYNVYRGTISYQLSLLVELGDVLWYSDNDASIGTMYHYRVSTVNRFGEGPMSYGVSAILVSPPSAPLAFQAFAGDSRINLTWEAPVENGGSPIVNYNIYRGVTSGDLSFLAEVGNVLKYSDRMVTNGVTYYYQIRALNAYKEGQLSFEAVAKPTTRPSAPLHLRVIAEGDQIDLRWSAPVDDGGSPITNYYIYRGFETGNLSFLEGVDNVLSYTDSTFFPGLPGLIPGLTYYYQVSAVNAPGEGPLSEESFVFLAIPPLPPENLTAVEEDGSVVLSWTAPLFDGGEPILKYVVLRSRSGEPDKEVGRVSYDVLTFTDEAPWTGVKYNYTVYATNAVGDGWGSEPAWMEILVPPNPPGRLEPEVKGGTIVLTWYPPIGKRGSAPATGYKVYRKTAEDDWELITTLGMVHNYTDEDVKRGTTYSYYLRATSDAGDSDGSSVTTAKIKEKKDDPGFGFVATLVALFAISSIILRRRLR